jgi:hypothetical protein
MKSRESICRHLNSVTAKPNEILDSPLPVRRALDKRSGNNNKVRTRSGSIIAGWICSVWPVEALGRSVAR